MGFGSLFMTWINLIYSVQEAIISLEGFTSSRIYRGVRKGCPLSPLLFNLVVETLARVASIAEGIKGMET